MKHILFLALCLPLAAQSPQPVQIIPYSGDYDSASTPTVQAECFDLSQIGADLTIPPCLAYQVSRSTVSYRVAPSRHGTTGRTPTAGT